MNNSELENQKFGSYQLLECLGNGGMGGVYRAEDTGLQREVAIKVMLPKLGANEALVEAFRKEAQAAAKLNDPHIAQIYAFGNEGGKPFIAMELLKGGSLDKKMANGPLDATYVMRVGRQIAMGLSAAAEAGLVHGDVKPENILFNDDGEAKLVDFGIAALMSSTEEIWGTPYYVSPEKVQKKKADLRSDIYSLGGTLYHAICGVPPFEGTDSNAVVKARFNGAPKPITAIRPDVPAKVQEIIGRMLEFDPARRYPTYLSLIKDMERCINAIGGTIRSTGNGKKLVIKGKGKSGNSGAGTDAAKSKPGQITINATIDGMPANLTPLQPIDPEDARGDKNKGCKIFATIAVCALCAIGIISGLIAWYLHNKEETAKQQALQNIVDQQTKTRSNIAKFVDVARKRVEELNTYPAKALDYAKKAEEQAVNVIGEKWREAMHPAKPAAIPLPELMTPSKPQPSEEEKKQTDGQLPAPQNMEELLKLVNDSFAKAKVNAKNMHKVYLLHKQGALTELPQNIEQITNAMKIAAKSLTALGTQSSFDSSKLNDDTKELLKAFGAVLINDTPAKTETNDGEKKSEAAKPKNEDSKMMGDDVIEGEESSEKTENTEEEKKEEEKKEEEKPAAEDSAPAPEPEPEPPVVKMVRNAYTDAYDVAAAHDFAVRALAVIEETALKEREITGNTVKAAEELAQLNNKIKEMVDILAYDKNITGISRKMSILEKSGKTIANELEIFEGLRRIAKREADKKAKAKAEEERKIREAEELKVKTENEVAQVAGVEAGNIELIKKLDFSQADRNLREINDAIVTDGGRTALMTARDRVRRLRKFHEFIYTKAKGYHSAKGWVISNTDKKYLNVGKNKVQWRDVYNERIEIFGELVMQFIGNSRSPMLREMKLKDRTDLMTNAALALSTFCATHPSAMKLARELAKSAAEKMEAYSDDIKMLVPVLFDESAEAPIAAENAGSDQKQNDADAKGTDAGNENAADDADFEE